MRMLGLGALGAAIVAWPIGYATNYQPLLWAVGVALVLIVTGLSTWQCILARIRKRLWEQVPLWSERFEEPMRDLAQLQNRVLRALWPGLPLPTARDYLFSSWASWVANDPWECREVRR